MSLDKRGIPQTKILIVDDEPAKVVLLVQMLEKEEFVNVCSVAGTHKATVAAQAPDEIDALATQVAELASRLKIAGEPDIPDIATAEQAREEYWEARQFSIKTFVAHERNVKIAGWREILLSIFRRQSEKIWSLAASRERRFWG